MCLRKMADDRAALWREEMLRDILCFAIWEILHLRREKAENCTTAARVLQELK